MSLGMNPLFNLVSGGLRRVAWSLFGASLATTIFTIRSSNALPRNACNNAAPPPEVHVHMAAPAAPSPAPAATFPPLAQAAPMAFTATPRALSQTDAYACSRAWADGGVYRASYGITYVTREYVDQTLENQADLMRSARIVPEAENGQTVGVRIFGVRPGTMLFQLGFQNGDSLRAIEGYSVASPEKALEAYARLRNAQDYHVEIVRLGQRVALLYRVC